MPTKKIRVIESMTKLSVLEKTIRVWRAESVLRDAYDNSDLQAICSVNMHLPIHVIAETIAKQPRVNAVEVLSGDGNGVLIYPEWP